MIEAGVRVLADEWGVIGNYSAEELAEAVFREMLAKSAIREKLAAYEADTNKGGVGDSTSKPVPRIASFK